MTFTGKISEYNSFNLTLLLKVKDYDFYWDTMGYTGDGLIKVACSNNRVEKIEGYYNEIYYYFFVVKGETTIFVLYNQLEDKLKDKIKQFTKNNKEILNVDFSISYMPVKR